MEISAHHLLQCSTPAGHFCRVFGCPEARRSQLPATGGGGGRHAGSPSFVGMLWAGTKCRRCHRWRTTKRAMTNSRPEGRRHRASQAKWQTPLSTAGVDLEPHLGLFQVKASHAALNQRILHWEKNFVRRILSLGLHNVSLEPLAVVSRDSGCGCGHDRKGPVNTAKCQTETSAALRSVSPIRTHTVAEIAAMPCRSLCQRHD